MATTSKRLFLLNSIVFVILYDIVRYNTFRGVLPLIKAALLFTLLQWTAWTFYHWMIYPSYISPLRHLPGPKGGSLFMGHFFENLKNAPGKQFQTWLLEVPNDGVIRYLDIFNSERILPVSPAALADVLVTRNYDFEKPAPLRKGISRILGLGLFLAEGDEHKRQRKTMMPAFNFRHVKNLYLTFWSLSLSLTTEITKHMASPTFSPTTGIEVNSWASRATLDIIGLAGMGASVSPLESHAISYPAPFLPRCALFFKAVLSRQ